MLRRCPAWAVLPAALCRCPAACILDVCIPVPIPCLNCLMTLACCLTDHYLSCLTDRVRLLLRRSTLPAAAPILAHGPLAPIHQTAARAVCCVTSSTFGSSWAIYMHAGCGMAKSGCCYTWQPLCIISVRRKCGCLCRLLLQLLLMPCAYWAAWQCGVIDLLLFSWWFSQ